MKKIPIRKCMACNESKPKQSLVRIVKSPEGIISVDVTGKKNGRGAYICRDIHCLEKLKKSNRLEKLFETKVGDEVYDALEKELNRIG